jgi:hypothetical protein
LAGHEFCIGTPLAPSETGDGQQPHQVMREVAMSALEIVAAALGGVAGWVLGGFIGRLLTLTPRTHPSARPEPQPYEHPEAA